MYILKNTNKICNLITTFNIKKTIQKLESDESSSNTLDQAIKLMSS